MKINNLWSLHYENFLMEIECNGIEEKDFTDELYKIWPEKNFLISNAQTGELIKVGDFKNVKGGVK